MGKETVDLTACLPQPTIIKVNGKEYKISFPFKVIAAIEEEYGTMTEALNAFYTPEDGKAYEHTANFLFAALGGKYKIKKEDIDEWITPKTLKLLHGAVSDALLASFGRSENEDAANTGEI